MNKGNISPEGYKKVSKELLKRFGCKYVAITLRESFSASDNGWSGLLYDGKNYYFSKKYKIHILDRVGGGDSFAAGLIYALLQNKTPEDVINFAAASSCLKQTIFGDVNLVSISEVEDLLKSGGSGRVER